MILRVLNIITVFALLQLTGCDAPHTNPLDPDNPDRQLSVLRGQVQSESIPRTPLEGVNVNWEPGGITVRTDDNGEYTIDNVDRVNGWLRFRKAGFMEDSFFVSWGTRKSISVTKFLNSVPDITELQIYSIVLNRFPTEQVYQLVVDVEISDVENDIDSVFVTNNDLEIEARLNEITKNVYRRTFSLIDLQLESLDEIIGKELSIEVNDRFDNRYSIGNSNLKRIIKQEVETITPKNNEDSVSVTPLLIWKRFLPGFNFKHKIQVYTNEVSPQLVLEKDNISKNEIDLQIEEPLTGSAQGEYFWVIWAIDEFNNRTRSKPATFKVLQ